MVVDPYLHFYIYTHMYACLVQLPPYYVCVWTPFEDLALYIGVHHIVWAGFPGFPWFRACPGTLLRLWSVLPVGSLYRVEGLALLLGAHLACVAVFPSSLCFVPVRAMCHGAGLSPRWSNRIYGDPYLIFYIYTYMSPCLVQLAPYCVEYPLGILPSIYINLRCTSTSNT